MRTLIILLAGFVLWGFCLGVARFAGGGRPRAYALATAAFGAIWFAVAAVNMWIGVSQAGYSFGEELPIFLMIFLVPVAVAVFVKWKVLKGT